MAIEAGLSTLLNIESHRAYSNLYDVSIFRWDSTKQNFSAIPELNARATRVEFEDSFGFNLEHNDAIQSFMFKGVNRIKGVNITFKESSEYNVITKIQNWMDSIYDFESHVFLPGDPTGSIELDLNNKLVFCQDVIPKSMSYPSYSWSESNPIEVQVSFSVGRVNMTNTSAWTQV